MLEKKIMAVPKTSVSPPLKVKVSRESDVNLGWVERDYPQLNAWRDLAIEWLKGETRDIRVKLQALVTFFERYLIKQGLPLNPAEFLAQGKVFPDFYQTVCPHSKAGIEYNNSIHIFLRFVLLREFSEESDDGKSVVSSAFCNPVPRLTKSGLPKHDESVYPPLPYGYIDELRQMLAAGAHFCDWRWAQASPDVELGQRGSTGHDWFEVTEDLIDRNDPDCVWRKRPKRNGNRLEMWSPVRWVALLVKLILPLRTTQVRMLDSGEADTWRYEAGTWALNTSRLAQGSERRPLQQGMFRRSRPITDGEMVSTVLYINTNKTADIATSGAEKGYVLPWSFGGPVHQDAYYLLERLRNWQYKYNPVSRRTAWAELDGRHTRVKSDVQLASYPDACFIFRRPEAVEGERHLPIQNRVLDGCWFMLLKALELRLAARGECHRNGTPIRFLPSPEKQNNATTTLFPLHSLRVSLITALALEGQMPFPLLQKLVGHSRLLMTLYYVKPGASYVHDVLLKAAKRLEENKEASIQNFLLETEYEELQKSAICNSVTSFAAVIPQHPAARNPAGWMPMHHGFCLVGGNTSEVEGNGAVGGCYNGGSLITKGFQGTNPKYGPVPGGSRNCVRCRWFVTEPRYLPALVAHFNTLAYYFDEARNVCLSRENELQDLKRQKVDNEDAGKPFTQLDAYRQAERIWESSMKRFSDFAEDLVACWRLIERCKATLEVSQGDSKLLVAAGTTLDVQVAFEETKSELLQLDSVCQSVEIYPDLEPGKAVFRRSQLLDSMLYRDDISPVFMLLNEEEQLLAGNAFMRNLAQQMNPANPVLGQRQVIHLIDAGVSLSQYFEMDLSKLTTTNLAKAFSDRRQIPTGDEV
ncbi:VPA1269 family protein [Pseudomonas sp. UBT]|uniref:gamma-mobile-trio integrase GmtZ n=1 Tax=Pseudomonas sp. UBT TaxID=3239198 RepID=UPI003D800BC9